jgi:hypothetical protein
MMSLGERAPEWQRFTRNYLKRRIVYESTPNSCRTAPQKAG